MNERTTDDVDRLDTELEREVQARAARKMRARRQGDRSVWFGLGMFGLIGWSVAVPSLIGIAIGLWIDKRWSGDHSWTLMLMILGVGIGCLNAWHWVQRESRDVTHDNSKRQRNQNNQPNGEL